MGGSGSTPSPSQGRDNHQGRIPGKGRSSSCLPSCGGLVLHSSPVHRCLWWGREAGEGSSTFRGALLGVAVAVAPGEVDQHPLPLLRLSHQRERFQERPAHGKGCLERCCWAGSCPRWGWKGVIYPPPSPTPCGGDAKGSMELRREMCCQTGSDPPRAGWHQDGLPRMGGKKFLPLAVVLYGMGFLGELLSTWGSRLWALLLKPTFGGSTLCQT